MSQRPGTEPAPAHVWMAPAEPDQRSTAHALLLSLTRSLLDREPVLRHDDLGRPHVDPLWVSISHGHDLVAVAACAAGPVGVDLERRRSVAVAGLADRWFDPLELVWMADQPDEVEAFLHLWTAKEAVGKALGRGLRGSGLRRLMPLPGGAAAAARQGGADNLASRLGASGEHPHDGRLGDSLLGARVPSEPQLGVVWLPLVDAVVAVALPSATRALEVEHHGAALRRTVASRTSFPVVVRGN